MQAPKTQLTLVLDSSRTTSKSCIHQVGFISSAAIPNGIESDDLTYDNASFSGHDNAGNGELYDWYLLVQGILINSFYEMKRGYGLSSEVAFWRSNYADYLVELYNGMRELMGLERTSCDAFRLGIAKRLKRDDDWLFPQTQRSPADVARSNARYANAWKRINELFPEGVDDNSSDYLFTPNLEEEDQRSRAEVAKMQLKEPPLPPQYDRRYAIAIG